MKNLLYVCALFLVLLGASPFSFGQRSLKDLQAIRVLVEDLNSEGRRTGLTEEQVKTDVELQLRKVGIRVDESASEFLYVSVQILEAEAIDHFVYCLLVALRQPVTLIRDSSIFAIAATWDRESFGIVPEDRAPRNNIRESIRNLVDNFLNDYLTVNPVTQ